MERGNTKHSPHLDEQMAREIRAQQAGARARDWDQPEPAGDDQPNPRLLPYGEVTGPADGPTPEEIAERSDFGRWIPRSVLPADQKSLVRAARAAGAPDGVLGQLEQLSPGETFETVVQIWAALGHPTETRAGVS